MIGLFEITDVRDAQTFCIAKSCMVESVKGRFYIPAEYRASVSTLSAGDVIFCVLDDSSGFGAILYKKDDGVAKDNTYNFNHDVAVGDNLVVSGQIESKTFIKAPDANLKHFSGNSSITTTITITPEVCAEILAVGASGAGVVELPVLSLNANFD